MTVPTPRLFKRRAAMGRLLSLGLVWLALSPETTVAGLSGAVRDLSDPDVLVRRRAVRELALPDLAARADRTVVPALLQRLGDPDARVRAGAARALAYARDERAVLPLARLLREDSDRTVRFQAAWALGELRRPAGAEALLAALRDPAWEVRDQAAWALRALDDARLAPKLLALLRQPDADGEHILWILRGIDPDAVGKAVAVMLESPDAGQRLQGVKAIAAFGTTAQKKRLLPTALRDHDAAVRRAALRELARTPEPDMKPVFEAILAKAPDEETRALARKALQDIRRAAGLVGYWNFDDGKAADLSGGGGDGVIQGARPVAGKRGKGLHFDGKAQVSLGRPATISIAHQPFTIAAWIKPEAPTGVVVARGGAWCGFSLFIREGRPGFGIHRKKDGPTYTATAANAIPLGEWTCLAGVVRPDRIELYVNGEPAANAKIPDLLPSNSGQEMVIGFDTANSSVGLTDHFVGVIDEVKAFADALDRKQIRKLCDPKPKNQDRKY